MNFNRHSELEGLHAFLSPSKYHWVNYNEDKLSETYKKYLAIQKGVRLHELAKDLIDMGVRLPKSKGTLNFYVNDAIGYKMKTEQPLYYSPNCFGTSDAIMFRNNFLRIHDYKSGQTPASMKQLEVYAALFCLEYKIAPHNIDMELRLYQSDEILVHKPYSGDIERITDKIITSDKQIEEIKAGEEFL